ncbi:MAG TPA: C40 family peptidase [Candidatus Jeotgalibaca pullicola]|nr:C40 family peptidase [Candidatus Jeotgalibaca pullicola]
MKKKLATLILTSSILSATFVAPYAASADELTDKIEEQEQKVNELSNRVDSAAAVLAEVQAEITAAEDRASELLNQRLATNEEIDLLKEEIAQLQQIIDQREGQLKEQARSVQVNGSNTNYMNFIFASESLTDLISRVDVVTTMVSANKDLVEQQVQDQQAVEDKKVESEEKLNDIMSMTYELEELKGQLEVKNIEQESALAALSAEKATAEEDRQRFIAEKEEADRRAAEEAERQRLAEEAAIAAAEAALLAEAEAAKAAEEAAQESVVEVASNQTPTVTAPTQTNNTTNTTVNTEVTTEVSQPSAPAPSTPVEKVEEKPAAPTISAPTGDVVSVAYKYLGVPYVWGGKTPSGFDCSGFTAYVFREAYGIEIGGWTGPQQYAGTQISVSQAQAGDLLFWGPKGSPYHVAIALGNGQYIHAPDEGGVVEVNSTQYFTPSFAVRVAR